MDVAALRLPSPSHMCRKRKGTPSAMLADQYDCYILFLESEQGSPAPQQKITDFDVEPDANQAAFIRNTPEHAPVAFILLARHFSSIFGIGYVLGFSTNRDGASI